MTDKSDEHKAVPREPTQTMIVAASGGAAGRPADEPDAAYYGSIWRAMYDAAPVLATAPAEPPKDGVAALIERLCDNANYTDLETGYGLPSWVRVPMLEAAGMLASWRSESGAVDAVGTTRPDSLGTSAAPPSEVAALIERVRLRRKRWTCEPPDRCFVCQDNDLLDEIAIALARLSAPVPDKPDHAAIADAYTKWAGGIQSGTDYSIFGAGYLAGQRAAPVPAREWIPVRERLPTMFETCIAYGIVKSLNVGRQMWEARRWTGANWPDPPWEWLTPCDLSITDVTHWYSLDRPGRVVVPATSDRALPPPPAADK